MLLMDCCFDGIGKTHNVHNAFDRHAQLDALDSRGAHSLSEIGRHTTDQNHGGNKQKDAAQFWIDPHVRGTDETG